MICSLQDIERFKSELAKVNFSSPSKGSIFIVGSPRSGTTYASQLLSYCFDIGYINNLIARFHWCPELGIKISEELSLKKKWSGSSSFGATSNITDPHEFGAFWRRFLGQDSMYQDCVEPRIRDLSESLERISQLFERPVLYKVFQLSWAMSDFHEFAVTKPKWIHIERDLEETALSILWLRHSLGSLSEWRSMVPKSAMQFMDPYDQVVSQVVGINDHIRRSSMEIDEAHFLKIDYLELINNQRETLKSLEDYLDLPIDEKAVSLLKREVQRSETPKFKSERAEFNKIHREKIDDAVERIFKRNPNVS